jgi:membrane-bound lytic murein transglycosylase B
MPRTWIWTTTWPLVRNNRSRVLRREFLTRVAGAAALLGTPLALSTQRVQPPMRGDYATFIEEMADKHGIDISLLRRLFSQVKPQLSIIRAMHAPSTSRPWYEFRKNHVDSVHIEGGAKFWLKHMATLTRAAREFGVPEEIIIATIGIETHYGSYAGSFRILDALATLAFDFPKRAAFFRGELEEFLLMGKETSLDIAGLRGSYAGAMGMPQFLPSSYRKYAVDFDGDGKRDLWRSVPDVIGSVANYYKLHDWQAGEAVVVPARVSETPDPKLSEDITPKTAIGEFRKLGIQPAAPVGDDMLAALLPLETESGMQYWFGLKNFYVITRYNRSTNYAMAVYEIAQGIKALIKAD